MRASWMAVKKLSGVAVPSCSCGSSHREARPACQARTSFPLAAAPAGDESKAAVDASAISIRAAATNRQRLMSGPPLGGSGGQIIAQFARARRLDNDPFQPIIPSLPGSFFVPLGSAPTLGDAGGFDMNRPTRFAFVTLLAALLLTLLAASPAAAAPEGQLTWAFHVSMAPSWFDPAETTGIITPFKFLYAMHDALVKSMPGNALAPSLAESWTVSPDSLVYEFVLRRGVRFHNGDPVTAEDVKFSMERYRGAGSGPFKARTAGIDVIDPHRIRFRFKQPWPDFLTFYGTPATGAGWVVPKKYVEKVGDDGFKRAPVGAGPYKFVSFTPGVELVLEANEQYWRKTPSVKRLVFKAVPEEGTRAAALKKGEVDIAYLLTGPVAEDIRRTPGLTLKASSPTFTEWVVFTEQWDPKSPWHDKRVRVAANHAIDRQAINDA